MGACVPWRAVRDSDPATLVVAASGIAVAVYPAPAGTGALGVFVPMPVVPSRLRHLARHRGTRYFAPHARDAAQAVADLVADCWARDSPEWRHRLPLVPRAGRARAAVVSLFPRRGKGTTRNPMPHWTLAAVARRALEDEGEAGAPLPLPGGAFRPGFGCVVRGHAATLTPAQLAWPGGGGLWLQSGADRVYRVRDGADPPLLLRYVFGDATAARPVLVRLFGLDATPRCFVHVDGCEVLGNAGSPAQRFLIDPETAVRELGPDELLDAVVARYRF